MTSRSIAVGLLISGALALSAAPAMAQKEKLSREAALAKCIAVMTQYVTFDHKAASAQEVGYDSAASSRRYHNLYNNCMRDHGQTP